MTNNNTIETTITNTENTTATETVYTIAARAALSEGRAITSKALAAAGMDAKEARAAFALYKESATALILSLVDVSAEVADNALTDATAVSLVSAAGRYMGYFAADKNARITALFQKKKETNKEVATRIAAALVVIAKDGKGKNVDGARMGTINASKDGIASAPARAALEQWAINSIDAVPALNSAAMLADKAAKAEARKAKKEAEEKAIAAAAEKAKAEMKAA